MINIKSMIMSRVESAIADYLNEDTVAEAIENALDDYDFESSVSTAIDNCLERIITEQIDSAMYDFDTDIEEMIEDVISEMV